MKKTGRCILLFMLLLVFITTTTFVEFSSLCSGSSFPIMTMETTASAEAMVHHHHQEEMIRDKENVKNINNNVTYWCIISSKTSSRTAARYSKHFPHAAENILPCWSWFLRQGAITSNNNNNCGFVFVGDKMRVRLPHPHSPAPSWQEQLVNAMHCQVREIANDERSLLQSSPSSSTTGATLEQPLGRNGTHLIQHTVPLQLKMPRYNRLVYLERREDATALRRLFVSDKEIYKMQMQGQEEGRRRRLQVGFVQRTKSRVITNLDDIVQGLQEALLPYYNVDLNVTTLQTPWLKEQAAWFASKDVIVAAHGAALTNAVFCKPGTIIMQIYPKHYFFQSLESLIEITGAIALDWYPNNGTTVVDPLMESKSADWRQRNRARDSNMTPPVHEIVDPILYALGKKPHSLEDVKPIFR